ncbi:MAG: GIY-YIG nuclease family protein [Candidatus Omnitrophica bacterium]|nr:GIY-YIG nuclease family protein [Candidatus Omnitrophota bacterium]
MWYVYILETKDKRFYTGSTNDVDRRMKMHAEGKGARFTRIFGFKKLLYTEACGETRAEALKREREIKKLTKEKKVELVYGKTT